MKKILLKILFFSIVFSFCYSLEYIFLSFANIIKNFSILYPSVTNNFIFEYRDYDDIFTWIKQSHNNLSFIDLSANVYEQINDLHHFNSSRGLAYFIPSIFLFLFKDPIFFTTVIYLIFLATNFFILSYCCYKFYSKNLFLIISITSLTIIFSNKLFGGVLNFYHFIDYFLHIPDFYNSSNLKRIPNNLINNLIIFLNFYFLKREYENNLNNSKILFIFLIISTFIDPIIYIIQATSISILVTLLFFRKKIDKIFLIKIYFTLFLSSLSLIFHYNNLNLINDGTLISEQWTGNYVYDLEIIVFPILIYIIFRDNFSNFIVEISLLVSALVLFISSFFYNIYLSSKINEDYIFLFTFFSFYILWNLFQNLKINKKNTYKLIFILATNVIYIIIQKNNHYLALYTILLILLFALFFFKKKFNLQKYISSFFIIIYSLLVLLSINSSMKQLYKFEKHIVNEFESDQKAFINWLNSNKDKNYITISLNFALLRNLNVHTSQFIFFPNLTTSNLNQENIENRLYDIFFLYNFSVSDLSNFLSTIVSYAELSDNDYIDINKKNIAVMIENIFHARIKTKYDKLEIKNYFLIGYKKYLDKKNFFNKKDFNLCVISFYDIKYVKPDSYLNYLTIYTTPVYKNSSISAYECEKNFFL